LGYEQSVSPRQHSQPETSGLYGGERKTHASTFLLINNKRKTYIVVVQEFKY